MLLSGSTWRMPSLESDEFAMSGWRGSHQVSLSSRWRWAGTGQDLFSRIDKFTFQDRRDATDACKELDGTRLCGNRVKVEMSNGGKGGRGGRGRSRWTVTVVPLAIRISLILRIKKSTSSTESINIIIIAEAHTEEEEAHQGGGAGAAAEEEGAGAGGQWHLGRLDPS